MNININQAHMYNRVISNIWRQTNRKMTFSYASKNQVGQNSQNKTQTEKLSETQSSKTIQRKEDNQQNQQEFHFEKDNRNTVGWWIYRFFFWGGFSLLSYNIYLVYNQKGNTKVENQPGAVPFFIDTAKFIVESIDDLTEFITQPPVKKLLPDTVHPDLQPKTLILNLTGTLLYTEYIYGKGHKYVLRPGLANFLNRLVTKYQLIIFAEEQSTFAMEALQRIDPKHQYIQSLLGKQCMIWRMGKYVKDLKYMNRDLRKIVVIDRNIQNVKLHPQNALIIPQFNGEQSDIELNKALVLLQRLASQEISDVRKAIQSIGKNPIEKYYQSFLQKSKQLQKKQQSISIFKRKQNYNKNKKKEQQDQY